MNSKILDMIKSCDMVRQGDEVAIAISGGADSVALLHFFCEIRETYHLRLTALHLNHNLRGAESARDEDFVRSFCEKRRVELRVRSLQIAELSRQGGLSIEECARAERYAFFVECAPSESAKIATAHTRSDSVETMLLNLTRGTGLRGLLGIPAVRGRFIRPLLGCTRAEIEAYCAENSLSFMTDSSNLSDNYSRNRLRHHVVPQLKTLNPAFEQTAAAAMELLHADSLYLDTLGERAREKLQRSENSYDSALYRSLEEPVRRRALIQMLRERDLAYSKERLELIESVIFAGTGSVQLSGKWFCHAGRDEFIFENPVKIPPQAYFEQTIPLEELSGIFAIPTDLRQNVQIIITDYEDFEKYYKVHEKLLKNVLDYDRIKTGVTLRRRLPGDKIRLDGRGCTKTLRKLFAEAGLSAAQRERLLVLSEDTATEQDSRSCPASSRFAGTKENGFQKARSASGCGASPLIWAEGFGAAEHVAVRPDTRRVLYLQIENKP